MADVGERGSAADADEEIDDTPAVAGENPLPEAPSLAVVDAPVRGEVQLLTSGNVRGVDYGYGPAGASVQQTVHAKGFTDRTIMRRTILVGTPRITSKTACQKMRSSNASGKKALPEPIWNDVMRAGLAGCDVAWLANRTVMLKAIPSDATERIQYHNSLMELCCVSLRELVEAMKQAKSKHAEKLAAVANAEERRSRSPRRGDGVLPPSAS